MIRNSLLSALLAIAVTALAQAPAPAAAPATPPAETNPFFEPSTLPYQAPPFDRIKDSDFQPAIEEGMKRERAEIETIASDPAPPTFANTIEAMERAGQLLGRVQRVFGGLAQSNTNPTLQQIQRVEAPKLAANRDATVLDPRLFARIKAVYDHRADSGLDAEARHVVERTYRNFVRSGALLSEDDKVKLRAINQEQSKLGNQFRERVLADTNASAVIVDDRSLLDGLPDSDIAAAAEKAKARGLEGKWIITLQNTTQQPPLTYLKNRALRERIFAASSQRCSHGGDNDTTAILARLAQLRADRAKLLGFPNFAAFNLDDEMAKTPENAIKLMTDLVPAMTAKTRAEATRMQKLIDAQKGGFTLGPEDWQFYAEQVRKAEFDLDESEVRPYFELDDVLQNGVFFAANKLYGITFKERKDIPVYHPDVRVFEVFDVDGKPLALFYADFFSRPSKAGGAWTSSFVGQSRLLGTRPVVTNTENITKPAPGQPALLTSTEVVTMFHEFGHALHGMFSNVTYPSVAGSSVPRDFVEFPSQFNEHWALDPAVFANYAKHYKTGAPMPKELVEKIRKSAKFNQGFALSEYLEAALLDMAWHALPAGAAPQDVSAFEPAALKRFGVDLAQVPPRYHTAYFSHIWGGGYAAGYYAYLWSEVLDDDAYAWFVEHGGMTRANGQRFRDMVLSRGGTEDPAVMYRAFRGRDPVVEPLLVERGLK
jgi:peptidyl-dipeptidase Dcp